MDLVLRKNGAHRIIICIAIIEGQAYYGIPERDIFRRVCGCRSRRTADAACQENEQQRGEFKGVSH